MAKTKAEIEKHITGFDKIINDPGTAAPLKKAMESAREKAKGELAELEKEESGKKEPVAKPAKKEKKVTKKPAAKEKKAGKEKKEGDEDKYFRIVNGVRYDMRICKEVLASVEARKKQTHASQEKHEGKSESEKIGDKIEGTTKAIASVISDEAIEKNPEKVVEALEKLEKDQSMAVVAFCKKVGASKTLTDKLEKAYSEAIAPIIKEIEEEIKKS